MARYTIRTLESEDFTALTQLEHDVFGAMGEEVLCPYYIRLVCDVFSDTCFVALDEGRPVAYLLSFITGKEAYCTTLAIRPEYQRTRVIIQLLGAFVRRIIDDVDACWFTVEKDNAAARSLHKMLGAVEAEVRRDFYGPGKDRIVSRIDRARFDELRPKYARLGLIDSPATAEDRAA